MNSILYMFIFIGSNFNHFYSNGNILSDELPVLEITEDFFTPKNGLYFDEAKLLIVEAIANPIEIKKVKKNIEIIEITTEKLWLNSQYQMYKINHSSEPRIVIIKDKKLVKILTGWGGAIMEVFLADLDKDLTYEVYFNCSVGFGEITDEIIGYNISSKESYLLSDRGLRNYRIFLEEDVLKVKYSVFENPTNESIGKLEFNKNYIPKLLVRLEKG